MTLFACAAGLAMLVIRFEIDWREMLSYALISVLGVAILLGCAALFARIIRFFSDRS
jgi:nitrate/nitrite transporter NarK